jgi:fructose-1,6-bisphosphatase-3
MALSFSAKELAVLRALALRFRNVERAAAEVAALRASLTLPKGAIHIVSDVHGEHKKLRHIINNASGRLRPVVRRLFADKLNEPELRELLAVLYYPREAMGHWHETLSGETQRKKWVRRILRLQFAIVRELALGYRRGQILELMTEEWQELFAELWREHSDGRPAAYVNAMLDSLSANGRDLQAVRAASRLIRNLSAEEIIVAGDLGDRGPRLDSVIGYLQQQPNVSFTWGNHDALWMGACLGQEALIATVLRVSIRYRRLSQLEEGYGVMCAPLEKLARDVYTGDPAACFKAKGAGLREDLMMARMQKAAAIMQFKLEGQTILRHPEWQMEHRALLHRIDYAQGTVNIDGADYPLRDTHLPTIDPNDPYKLSPEETACLKRLKQSFVTSQRMWEQMSYLARRGATWLRRDDALIFHACAPVDETGAFMSLEVDGQTHAGRPLFDALDTVVRRAFRDGYDVNQDDQDWFWYLWTGPVSPLFGKDRMATFETYFVEDKATHKEHKNAYFPLIHEVDFCRKILGEFGLKDGFIVNGHVPVKVEKGEEPVKRSGLAITIDGAFSEAYGDRGYTLILSANRVALAEHHHFESIEEAITSGADIVPKVTNFKEYPRPRRRADTEQGAEIRQQIAALERLIRAYQEGAL